MQLQRLYPRRLYPFEALAEIFDFVAGLVQRVPKKPNKMKADLLNSSASQGNCSWDVLVQRVSKKTSIAKSDLLNSTASQGDCSWEGIF